MICDTTNTTSPKQAERSEKMTVALDKKRFGPWTLVTGGLVLRQPQDCYHYNGLLNRCTSETALRGALSPFTLAPETLARRSCHRDKSDHVHPVPKRLSVRAY